MLIEFNLRAEDPTPLKARKWHDVGVELGSLPCPLSWNLWLRKEPVGPGTDTFTKI